MTEALEGGAVWYLRKCLYCPRTFRTRNKEKYYCNRDGTCKKRAENGEGATLIDERPDYLKTNYYNENPAPQYLGQ